MPDNKVISQALSSKEELKKYMKRVMPFVQATREKLEKSGLQALSLTLEFNEIDVLNQNIDYLTNTLDVSSDEYFECKIMNTAVRSKMVFI